MRVNDKLCTILGYPRDALMKLTFQGITYPEDLEADLNYVRQLLARKINTYVMQKRYIRQDQSVVWSNLSVSLARTAAGEPKHFISVVEDITERKRTEKAMQELSGRLITAQEDERRRLARELHDDITQRLASLAIEVGRVERGVSDAALAAPMGEVREGLIRLSEDVHSLSYRLHPVLLEDLGLIEALKAEGELFTRHESVPVKVKSRDVPDLVPQATALCLFRVAQEALRNAGRHSRARKMVISLRGLDGGLQLAVRDDGCGFDPALHRERGSLGLASMQERVRLLAGELDIESAPGHGTSIVAWGPLEKAEG